MTYVAIQYIKVWLLKSRANTTQIIFNYFKFKKFVDIGISRERIVVCSA